MFTTILLATSVDRFFPKIYELGNVVNKKVLLVNARGTMPGVYPSPGQGYPILTWLEVPHLNLTRGYPILT